MRRADTAGEALKAYSPRFTRFFVRYLKGYFAKRFHALRGLNLPERIAPDRPVVIYANHPGWWDPIVLLILSQAYFGDRRNFGVIDADALEAYAIFKRCGLFGVDQESRAGALRFLEVSDHILSAAGTSLWITPQGAFKDVRVRPLGFRAGLERLASRSERAVFIPLALEYAYGEESQPEGFFSFGAPVEASEVVSGPAGLLEDRLAAEMDALSERVIARDLSAFTALIDGASGVAWYYELWRRVKALARGERYSAAHRDVKR